MKKPVNCAALIMFVKNALVAAAVLVQALVLAVHRSAVMAHRVLRVAISHLTKARAARVTTTISAIAPKARVLRLTVALAHKAIVSQLANSNRGMCRKALIPAHA